MKIPPLPLVACALNVYALSSILSSFNFYFYIPVRYFVLNKHPCRLCLNVRF